MERNKLKYFEEEIRIISDALHSIDENVYECLLTECIETVRKGHRIIASGLGKNVPVCEKFVGSLNSLGIDAVFLHTNSAVHGDMGVVRDGDLVILLTKSGATSESVYLAGKLQEREVKLWLLTFEENSILTKMVDRCVCLKLEHEGDLWNIMPNNSTTLNLIVLQGIAMNMAKRLCIPLEQFSRNHPGGNIGRKLESDQL